MTHTACLVYLISSFSGRSKKKKAKNAAQVLGTHTKTWAIYLFRYLWIKGLNGVQKTSEKKILNGIERNSMVLNKNLWFWTKIYGIERNYMVLNPNEHYCSISFNIVQFCNEQFSFCYRLYYNFSKRYQFFNENQWYDLNYDRSCLVKQFQLFLLKSTSYWQRRN